MENTQSFIAHAKPGGEHLLEDHLKKVGDRAARFASGFNSSDWGFLAGIWHDMGKYKPEFQAYIRCQNQEIYPDAHLETHPGKVNHSSMGALHAVARFQGKGRILAYLIASHHTGLLNWHHNEGASPLSIRLEELDEKEAYEKVKSSIPAELLNCPLPTSRPAVSSSLLAVSLWVRMLFSCLVDADFLDTEDFFDPEKSQQRGSWPSIETLLGQFDQYMAQKSANASSTLVNALRNTILQECTNGAAQKPGVFSLTVPTGGGKTLSSMAFALNHAFHHKKERIIYVIPYTSIIEQTSAIFKGIFGEDNVIEHHSNLDPETETPQSRLACENWDAPIIVTTNVQFFESFFAARTSKVRKLHNIVNSVVILDEAQLLPTEFLKPILELLKELTHAYGVTTLLSTATQPVFSAEGLRVAVKERDLRGLNNVQELISDPESLYRAFNRVCVTFPPDFQTQKTWEEVAIELSSNPQVLCIVNKRNDCRALYQLMPPETIHLSALMCAAHRSDVIATIKQKLADGEETRVISTQLVEAGVDLDFPVVYRAMAGLDSIAQAAGRCNREGKLSNGTVVVFNPPSNPPPGVLTKAYQACKTVLSQNNLEDPLALSNFKEFFLHFFSSANSFDQYDILNDLFDPELKIEFRTAAKNFKLIDESAYLPVIVQYGKSGEWIGCLKSKGPERWLMRKLQRYIVTIPPKLHQSMLKQGDLLEVSPGIFTQAYPELYDPNLGLLTGEGEAFSAPEMLIV